MVEQCKKRDEAARQAEIQQAAREQRCHSSCRHRRVESEVRKSLDQDPDWFVAVTNDDCLSSCLGSSVDWVRCMHWLLVREQNSSRVSAPSY